jgi:hypothetical protein
MRSSTPPALYMNELIVGADKSFIHGCLGLHFAFSRRSWYRRSRFRVDVRSKFLFIDDGPLLDALEIPERRKVIWFDASHHCFNPLHGMDYRRARAFIAVLDAVFPEGETPSRRRTRT